jgi:hypothetical protein
LTWFAFGKTEIIRVAPTAENPPKPAGGDLVVLLSISEQNQMMMFFPI